MELKVHLQMVDLKRIGLSNKAIAKITRVPLAAVIVILRSPLAAAEVERGRPA